MVYKGELLRDAMERERVTEEEIREAARAHGCTSLTAIFSVVLETTGELNVIKDSGDEMDEVITVIPNHPNSCPS